MEIDKKELIRKSSAIAFAKEGYHNTTVKMIAEEANIAVGTIYLYFKTKEEILDYIFLIEHDKRIKHLEKLKKNDMNIGQVVESFLEFNFKELKQNPSIGKVLVQEGISPVTSNAQGIKKYQTLFPDIFSKMLNISKQKEDLRNFDPEIVANLIFYLIRGSVCLMQQNSSLEWERKIKKEILEFILSAIRK